MQPFCAKAESESRFQRWRFFLGDLVPRALPQAHGEMRLWRNTILWRTSTENSAFGAKQSKGEKACAHYSLFPLVPQRAVKRANSATDCTFIFAITWARCILTVASVMPRSPAICLFNLPETTCSSTSRSRGERVETGADFGKFGLFPASDTVSFNSCANRCEQIFVLRGLGKEIKRALFHRLHTLRNITVAGEKNNRQDAAFFGQRSLKLEAVEVRHRNIKHETSGRGWIVLRKKFPG